MPKCDFTGKKPHAVNNVPKSMHKTRRMVQPNVQKIGGVKMSTRFRRTLVKYGLLEKGKTAELSQIFRTR